MRGPIVLTSAEHRAVVAELGHDHNTHDVASTIDRVLTAVNTVLARPKSEASQ